ncbi:ABC transporter ATP-binding protein [Clostridium sp. KNHs216]|uniref:ABC transporter ATP-binding protein n=1 Tax=Clostridium sp. KNHs216 TaxID=1550235 RepID=UPI0011515E43|nr:ABC transporter ATP-binding protein [Clostridium sp. KNHs216]MBE6830766.1 ABC transporter ATP-binding protein [Oscillospiraceae bacterium]TQI66101.1 branched-chain amino acid transport system ATP-binding protein [Clostridium sp. KNHs216]
MSDIVLEVKGLTKRFEGLLAVDNLSFQVTKGRLHALIGPNGAGKTTTVNMITGVYPQTEGAIEFFGEEISGKQPYQRAEMGIGRTFQNIKLFPTMTVLENLMLGAQSRTGQNILKWLLLPAQARNEEKKLREQAESVLNEIGLYPLKEEVVSNLPYGRQKMTELGRTLMGNPKLILLDEPAAGLNPSERKEFVGIIDKIAQSGVDMFLIEHNMDVVMSISKDITVLDFGKKIASGSPAEIQCNEEVITAYLGEGYRMQQEKKRTEGGIDNA